MNRRFKKLIAVVCAIAMVVTSVTVYNTVKADADFTVVTEKMDSTYAYKITTNTLAGFGRLYFYGNQFMQIIGSGDSKMKNASITLDGTEVTNTFAFDRAEAVTGFNLSTLADNKEYTIALSGDGGNITIVLRKGTVESGETTTTDPSAPPTTPAPTTTPEPTDLQAPTGGAGTVITKEHFNDADGDVIFAVGLDTFERATSYELYINDEYFAPIANGGIVKVSDILAKYEAGTYTFTVRGVNEAGKSEPSKGFELTIGGATEETTTPTTPEVTTPAGEEFDPSTITDWTQVANSTTLSYYIVEGKDVRAIQQPKMDGTEFYAAYAVDGPVKAFLDGQEIGRVAGVGFWVPKDSFKEGYSKLVVKDAFGVDKVTMYIKAEKEPETTTAAYVDGKVLVNEANVTKEVSAIEGGNPWQADFNNVPVNYVQGKKYVAEVVVSSDVAKKIKLVFQNTEGYSFIDADGGYEVDIAAGSKVKITYVFEATQSTDNGNFDIYLGYPGEAAVLNFESKTLTTYNEVPEGVTTGVEVLSTPVDPETKVTVDGTEVAVEDGKVTLGDAEYGYFCAGKMYAPNTAVEVTEDMAFTSVDELSVTMENGAGIRYIGTAGIRFQASVASDNMDAVASDAITEGTLITANDIYQNFGEELTLTYSHAKIDVKNSGWFNGQIGTYCGSICNVIESNYIREFTARAYVTINYENADAKTIYSNMGPERSISKIATVVKSKPDYAGIAKEYWSIIDSFIK